MPASSDVLLACAGDPAVPGSGARLRAALTRVSDWDELGSTALRHGMAALLYQRTSDWCPDAVPPDVLASWREVSRGVAVRSLRMQQSLVVLLERLADADVRALTFKGPVLAQQLYGDATLRHFSDLDVLVHPSDVTVAHAVALTAGYADVYPFDFGSESRRQRGEQEICLHHDGTGVHVEIHWRVGSRFAADALPADALFSRSRELELLGREVTGLGSLDVVLVLVVHAASHVWTRLEDVAALAAGLRGLGAAEATELESLAAAHACRRRLHIGVLLATVLARGPAAETLVSSATADARAKDLAAWAGAHLLWETRDAAANPGSARRDRVCGALWQALALDSPLASARSSWNRLLVAGARDWGDGPDEAEGPWNGTRTLIRRQRRMWRL